MLLKWISRRRQPAAGTATPLEQARALRLQGDFAAARQVCQELLREAPDDARAMALMAAIAADQGQFGNGVQWARQALAADRDCVPAHFALGRLLEGTENFQQAEASYRRVVELDPRNAQGHTNLGCMLHIQRRMDEAMTCYRKALALEPGQPEALRNYALLAGTEAQFKEALEGFEQRVAIHPKDAPALHQLGQIYVHLARHDQALAAYDRAIALAPEQAEFHFARAQLLLLLEDYDQGWREYEWRWRMDQFNQTMSRFPQPRWNGQPLENGTLLIHGEDGFGDTFQFVRYASLAAKLCAHVVVECQPELQALVARVEGVSRVVPQGQALPAFDAHIPLICLPGAFRTTVDSIPWSGPYIRAEPAAIAAWKEAIRAVAPRSRKVGLVWTGNPQNLNNRERSLTLQHYACLAPAADVSFFSLQKGAPPPAPGTLPAGMHFIDMTGELHSFSDTAALLSQLDLVVTIDTGVAHLAGAMGRPTWVLLPMSPDWRYHAHRSDNPWYPGMRLFRQHTNGDWTVALQQLQQALVAWAGTAAGLPADR